MANNLPFLTDEEVVEFWLEKHYFVRIFVSLVLVVVCVLPVAVFLYVYVKINSTIPIWLIWIISWYELFMLVFIFQKFIEEVLDMIVVTNKRIVNIEQKSFFHREVSSAMLNQIQDVSYKKTSVFGTLFDYGEVIVQTAAENAFFTMSFVSDPDGAQDRISQIINGIKLNGSKLNVPEKI